MNYGEFKSFFEMLEILAASPLNSKKVKEKNAPKKKPKAK